MKITIHDFNANISFWFGIGTLNLTFFNILQEVRSLVQPMVHYYIFNRIGKPRPIQPDPYRNNALYISFAFTSTTRTDTHEWRWTLWYPLALRLCSLLEDSNSRLCATELPGKATFRKSTQRTSQKPTTEKTRESQNNSILWTRKLTFNSHFIFRMFYNSAKINIVATLYMFHNFTRIRFAAILLLKHCLPPGMMRMVSMEN